MTVVAWPLVSRDRVVRAFRPGARTSSEAPFRTLRSHQWATPGVRVTRRRLARLSGQTVVFSTLNVEAARLARHGHAGAARRMALAAADMESSPAFTQLVDALAQLDEIGISDILRGDLPADTPQALTDALRAVASATDQLRATEKLLNEFTQQICGQITEVHDSFVLLAIAWHPPAAVPRWLASAAGRDRVGEFLALITDQLDLSSAVVDVLPALAVDRPTWVAGFTPFGRSAAALTINQEDERLLSRSPEPLTIVVPVQIDA